MWLEPLSDGSNSLSLPSHRTRIGDPARQTSSFRNWREPFRSPDRKKKRAESHRQKQSGMHSARNQSSHDASAEFIKRVKRVAPDHAAASTDEERRPK